MEVEAVAGDDRPSTGRMGAGSPALRLAASAAGAGRSSVAAERPVASHRRGRLHPKRRE